MWNSWNLNYEMKLILILMFFKLYHCKISIPKGIFEVTDALEAEENRAGFENLKRIAAAANKLNGIESELNIFLRNSFIIY